MISGKKRWGILFAVWTASYGVLLGIFSDGERAFVDYLYTGLFLLTLAIVAWVGEAYVRSRWLSRGRYVEFVTLWVALVLTGAAFNQLFFAHLVDYIFPGYYFISYYRYWDIVKFFGAFVGLSTLVGMAIEWFQLQANAREWALIAKEKSDAEFKALASQVNPHFLFNSLAVIYSLAVQSKGETANAVLHLSDLLRYVVYRSDRNVKVEDEIKVLSDYIQLQRYRVHPSTRVVFEHKVDGAWELAPMLLLPLLENAFKHGVQSSTEGAFVHISLSTTKQLFTFDIRNSFGHDERNNLGTRSGGVGLENIQKRLALLYPGRHRFFTKSENDVFHVRLEIGAVSIPLSTR